MLWVYDDSDLEIFFVSKMLSKEDTSQKNSGMEKPDNGSNDTNVSSDYSAANNDNIPKDASRLLDKLISGHDNKYRILELIGRGGSSDVYKAKIEITENENSLNRTQVNSKDRIVACKVLLERLLDNKQHYRRFQHEATLAKRLIHPNIVNVHDAGEIDGRPFIILDYLEGTALSDICEGTASIPINRALAILLQIGKAFAYAHLNNIIHRDLKPGNIMLTKTKDHDDFVKVVDFGIAKIITETTMGATKLTKTGAIFGSPLYMSPEQCRGDTLDVRSDIYSFGILMYEVLTGSTPFKGSDTVSTMYKHTMETPKSIGDIDGDVLLATKLERTVFKCLEKEPTSRYQTMDDLVRDLELVQLYLDQLRSGQKNAVLLAVQRIWLSLSQFIAKTGVELFSRRLSSFGLTIGSVTLIVSIVLIAICIPGAIFLFGPSTGSNIVDRELWLKPIVDSPVKYLNQNAGDMLWHRLQLESTPRPEILEPALKTFIQLGKSYQKSADYDRADLCYSRAEQIARLLKLATSILLADILDSHAENQLLANMAMGSLAQQRNEQTILKEKHFDVFVKPETLRSLELRLSTNAALARDYTLEALTIMNQLGNGESVQSLVAYALLAQSHAEMNYGDLAMKPFETFRCYLAKPNLYDQMDKPRRAIILAWAGRAYMEPGVRR